MSLKFNDGFDHYAPDGTTGVVLQPYLESAGYTIQNATAATLAVVAGRRTGAHALQFTVARNSSTNASISWGFTPTNNYVCFGFAMNASGSRMRICRIANVVDVDWDTVTGKLMVGSQLGVNPLILNAWYYFEVEIDITANTIKIYANDELQLTVTPSGTLPSLYTIVWGQVGTAPDAGVQLIDDFYAMDGSGSINFTRLSPIEITSRAPTADVSTQWTVVNAAGGTPHYQIVAQLLPGATSAPYLQSNTAGATDMFSSNTVLPTSNKVFGVSVLAYAKKGDLDDRKLGMVIQAAGGTAQETQVTLTEAYKYYQVTYEQTPGGDAWNQNNVESLQFGIVAR